MDNAPAATGTIDIEAVGPWSFATAIRFWEGFTPAAYERTGDAELRIAFAVDGTWEAGGAWIRPLPGSGCGVRIETYGLAPPDAIAGQVARVLSLDVDERGFDRILAADPALAALGERFPGFRPVLFYSPYEAAAWAIIGNRIRITQASRLKRRIAEDLGTPVRIGDHHAFAFPPPQRLLEIDAFPGLTDRKIAFLHSLAMFALDGDLDPDLLRAKPTPDLLDHFKQVKGIGDFGAELTMIRGLGRTDVVPTQESRFAAAVAHVYGMDHPPDTDELEKLTSTWAPFRSWVTVLVRLALEADTGDIVGNSTKDRS